MSTPTSQQYFKTLIPHLNLDWKLIYLLPRKLTKNPSLRAFQYKVLKNMLYLNHKLFQFKVSTTSLCSYCNKHDETVHHLFSTCNEVISLWTEIKLYFLNDIKLIALCPQIAILGYTNTDDRCFITQNLILLIFEFYVYKSRGSGNVRFSAFLWKEMVIYRKCFAIWIRMQIIQNNKKNPTPIKLYFNNCGRDGGFYNFFQWLI